MQLTITGADGFVGRAVVRALLDNGFPRDDLTLVDRAPDARSCGVIAGDLTDPAVVKRATDGCDTLLHLAALPGGAAEQDPALSRQVNLDLPLRLIDAMQGRRLIIAGSIAVFGSAPKGPISDATAPRPDSVYGAHKAMVELAFADAARRGAVKGALLRLPGVVARPASAAGFGSAWMSDIFHAAQGGRPLILPVTRDSTCWMASATATAANLAHAIMAGVDAPHPVTLPALRVRVGELLDLVAARCGSVPVVHREDASIQRMFASYPDLSTPHARRLGFRDDGDLAALIDTVLADIAMDTSRPVAQDHVVQTARS